MPADFWNHADLRAALTTRHFGRVLRAYRCHPLHGVRPLAQELVARWLGITQPQLSRIENGPPSRDLDRLVAWARLLSIPEHLLWFRLPSGTPPAGSASGASSLVGRSAPRTVTRHLMLTGADDLTTAQSLRIADRQVGGGYLYGTVTTYLQQHVGPRLFGIGEEAGGEVFTIAAALTEMAGWMAHDAGLDLVANDTSTGRWRSPGWVMMASSKPTSSAA